MDTESGPQLEICFITKQDIYAVPSVPFSVPQDINNVHLNKILNELLQNFSGRSKQVQFDFLVNDQILRLPLIDHLKGSNISSETTIDVEYIERTEAPEPENALLHDDWIGGVQVADNWVLTGSYDNTVNIWTIHGKHESMSQEHTNMVKSVSWLKKSDPEGGFVTVSHDLTGMLWTWRPGDILPLPVTVLRGHSRGIDCVNVSPNSERLATGGWDAHLKVWSASTDLDDNYEPHSKKIKPNIHLPSRTPIHTLQGHKENIVSVQWLEPQLICSASMDHTIKLWDTELGGLQTEIVAEKAFLGASWSHLCRSIIACSADRHIRLYDPRSTEGSICKMIFTSHSLWVSAITWSQSDEHLFMSGSYDECVKLWDTRCPKAPLYDLSGHQGKVLCVDWSNPKYLVSGGTDCSLHIFKKRHGN